MSLELRFSEVSQSSKMRLKDIKAFLDASDLDMSDDVEVFIVAKHDEKIVACGGIAGRVLKNIAIDDSMRGEGVALSLISEILKVAYRMDRHDLFLFTKPKYGDVFEGCGFKAIEEVKGEVLLMENSYNLERYQKRLERFRKNGEIIGTIVINANPFTLGHRYLIEEASKRCDYLHLFVVKEDASRFLFEDRYRLISQGIEDLENVILHEGSEYIISKATFPTYFIKDKGKIDSLFTELDLKIFKNRIAPRLGITHRFVGHEPYCAVTNEYNQQMKRILNKKDDSPPIEVIEIERTTSSEKAISASWVRALMDEDRYDEIKNLVPKTTYDFLLQIRGED